MFRRSDVEATLRTVVRRQVTLTSFQRLLIAVWAGAVVLVTWHFVSGPHLTYSHPEFATPRDHQWYIHAASHPLECASIAQCWRPAVPLIAGLLPLPLQLAFGMLTFSVLTLLAPMLCAYLRQQDITPGGAVLGVTMFYTIPLISFQVYDFWLVDAHALLAVLVVLYAIETGRDRLYIVSLALGVAVKEPVLFAAPLYYTLNVSWSDLIDRNLAIRTIAYGLPAVVVFFGIRQMVGLPPGYDAEIPAALVQLLGGTQTNHIMNAPHPVRRALWTTWGLIPLFAVLAPQQTFRRAGRYAPFLLLVGYQLTFSTGAQRYLPLATPVLIPMAVRGLRSQSDWDNTVDFLPREWGVLPFAVPFAVIAVLLPFYHYKMGLPVHLQLSIFVGGVIGVVAVSWASEILLIESGSIW